MKASIKLFFIIYAFAADAFLFSGCNCGLGSGLFGGCANAYTTQQYYDPYYYNAYYQQPYYQQPYYQQPYYQPVPYATTNQQQPLAPTATSTQTSGAALTTPQTQSFNTVAPAAAQAPAEAPQPISGPNETPNLPEVPVENAAVTPAPEARARSGFEYSFAGKSNSLYPRQQQNWQFSERNAPLYSGRSSYELLERHVPSTYETGSAMRSNLPLQSERSSYQLLERHVPSTYKTASAMRSNLPLQSERSSYQLLERYAPLSHEAASSGRSNLRNVLLEPKELQGNARSASWQQLGNSAAARSALITILQEPAIAEQQLSSQQRPLNLQNAGSQIINPPNSGVQLMRTLFTNVPLSKHLKYDSEINPGSQYSVNADTPYPEEYQFYDNRLSPISYDDLPENEFAEADEYFSPSLTSWDEQVDVSPVFYHDTDENKWYHL